MNTGFFARRFLYGDLSELASLASRQSADYSLYKTDTLYSIVQFGEGWCCTQKGIIACAGGFVPAFCDCELSIAARKTGLFGDNSLLVLPAISTEGFNGRERFLEWCVSRAASKDEVIYALLPVKSGSQELPVYFDMGLVLRAIRPLYALRAYYIFARGDVEMPREGSIMVNMSDTYTISRFLSNGYCGVDIVTFGDEKKIELVKYVI